MTLYSSGAGSTKPIILGTVFNAAVNADADIFSSNLKVTSDGIIRVTVSLSVDAILRARVTRGGATALVDYNGGVDLTGNSVYMFDLGVRENDEVNFQVSANVTVNLMSVDLITATGP